jgi:molybdate transport system substrate-binding protein
MGLPGIVVLGPLPPAIQSMTTFSGGVAATSAQPQAARDLLAFLAAPAAAEVKRKGGMEPA